MSILDRAKAHLAEQPTSHIDVPEWGDGDAPLRVFFRPWTVAQRKKVFLRDERGLTPDFPTVGVRTLIEKGLDENGKRLFDSVAWAHALTYEVDDAVVARIANPILNGLPMNGDAADDLIDKTKNG